MDTAARPMQHPILFWSAIAVAASHALLIWLMHAFGGPCGDGLCGFWEAIFIWLLCALGSAALAVIGWVRGERPRWLVLLVPAALGAPLIVLMVWVMYTQGG